jgi:hypothetical protein
MGPRLGRVCRCEYEFDFNSVCYILKHTQLTKNMANKKVLQDSCKKLRNQIE